MFGLVGLAYDLGFIIGCLPTLGLDVTTGRRQFYINCVTARDFVVRYVIWVRTSGHAKIVLH